MLQAKNSDAKSGEKCILNIIVAIPSNGCLVREKNVNKQERFDWKITRILITNIIIIENHNN